MQKLFEDLEVRMIKKRKILEYLIKEYDPTSIIVYGSFANDTNDAHSDFDALVICSKSHKMHDDNVIDNTELDVFIYPTEYFVDEYDISEILQIENGDLLLDKEGIGARLLQEVEAYVSNYDVKSIAEKQMELSWCKKMLKRIEREDIEGLYRWHWLLMDSLEIYFDIKNEMYLGPKKSLDLLLKYDKKGFEIYKDALEFKEVDSLKKWINYLEKSLN